MDPQKQKQLINQMLQASAKSEEDLEKMSPEERHAYLQGRLKQKMFFNTARRQSNHQKETLQQKMQEKLQQTAENKESKEKSESQKERIRRKRQKKKEKMKLKEENEESSTDDDVVIVKDPNKDGSESDYHSD